ncbi:MAG: rhodanese-like domain-containing protein [Undibacterium sp.]
MREQNRSEGRVILALALLMFGGAAYMLGKTWYNHSKEQSATELASEGLSNLRYMSPKNILDRIAKNEELHFIDIRSRESFDRNHVIDSEWLGLPEIAYFTAPTSKLIIIVYSEENTNDQLREINALYTKKGLSFAFIEGGIQGWVNQGGAIISEANPESYLDRTKVIPIEPEKVTPLRDSLVRSTLLDVRSDLEFSNGHIPGAINIPLARLEKERGSIPAIGSLFVYGASESDSFQAGAKLFDMSYIGLRVISGGFEAWKEKGLPIEMKK